MKPFVLGIIGDSGSGKNTVADGVAALLGSERVTDLRLDDYHRFTREERAARGITALNPAVHNLPLMREHLQLLRQGRQIRNRSYNHSDGSFGAIRVIKPRKVVLARGLLGYPNEELRAMYDLTVFLAPEPELLFRWKLRRDVNFRGYTETEVLKNITHHLLDAKQYVLPQAMRADLMVSYEIPEWDSPDADVRTTLLFRRVAAEVAEELLTSTSLADHLEWTRVGEDLQLELPSDLPNEDVERWARQLFPESYQPDHVGTFTEADGSAVHSTRLTLVEVMIARLTETIHSE